MLQDLTRMLHSFDRICFQGRTVRFARGQNNSPPPGGILPPTLNYNLCEIYYLISSFGIHKSYHSRPKQSTIISRARGGRRAGRRPGGIPYINNHGANVLATLPPPPPTARVFGEEISTSKSATSPTYMLFWFPCISAF